MKFLVTVLTSSKPQLARLAVDSILAQQRHDWDHDVLVVVNSRNEEHRDAVARALQGAIQANGKPVEIVETPSNGRAGRGHNSLLDIFRERVQYDYLIPIDGDDAYYPCAFHQLDKFLPIEPHCVAIQTNDALVRGEAHGRHVILRDDWRITSWLDDCENWWKTIGLTNPFTTPLNTCGTPARVVLLHRSALAHLPAQPYGEGMILFDDLLMFAHLCEAWYRRPSGKNAFRPFFTSNTYMYFYNDMNCDNMTHARMDYAQEQINFDAAFASFKDIRSWHLNALPHAKISNPDWFDTRHKAAFAERVIDRLLAMTGADAPEARGSYEAPDSPETTVKRSVVHKPAAPAV